MRKMFVIAGVALLGTGLYVQDATVSKTADARIDSEGKGESKSKAWWRFWQVASMLTQKTVR